MTIVNGRYTSEVGRPTLGRTKKPAKVVVVDSTTLLTDGERAQLVGALEYLTKHGTKIRMSDSVSLWGEILAKLTAANRVRFETTREIA